jgi:TolB-like protein
MSAEPARLLELAEAIADGRAVDWEAAVAPGTDADLELVKQLRVLAGLADLHRSSAADTWGPAATEATSSEPLGERWGPLEIREWIGAGSYGVVYRAWDPQLRREVALKLHSRRGTADASSSIEEGRRLARIRHPHVITVHGADELAGRLGIWMEFIRGRTLEQVLSENGPLGAREASLVGTDLCGAVAAVHGAGLIHRDIKAQNVMREDGGRIVLMDFGAGEDALVGRGAAVGTPLYMAPELLAGSPASPQTDIYSLGVLLYRLVTCDYPVHGRTRDEVRAAHEGGKRQRLRDARPDLPLPFVAVIERAIDPAPAARFESPGEMEAALARTLAAAPVRPRRVAWTFAAAAILAVAIAAGVWTSGRVPAAPATAVEPAGSMRSVAVLPFTTLSAEPAQQYFAEAIADLLLSRLAELNALRVISRTSSSRYRGASLSLPDIGTALGADGIVEGTVQRDGERVRVTARLIRASTDSLVWSRSYERSAGDAFAIEREIARDLATALGVSLSGRAERRLNARYQASAAAQDDYLRARVLLYSVARDQLEQARTLLEHAIAVDPNYDVAYAALARCYLALQNVGVLTPPAAAALARDAATRALALDPESAEALTSLAQVRFNFDWDWPGAGDAFRRALEINPSNSGGRSRYARYLAAAGRTQEAIEQARIGIELDPLSAEMHDCMAMCLYWAGRPAEALAILEQGPPTPPGAPRGHTIAGRLYSAVGRIEDALVEMDAAYKLTRDRAMLAEIGRLHAVAGRPAEARRVLAALVSDRESGAAYVFPEDIAYIQVALGDRDEAFAWLGRSIDERSSRILWLRVEPRVDPLRKDPRFARLLARIGP